MGNVTHNNVSLFASVDLRSTHKSENYAHFVFLQLLEGLSELSLQPPCKRSVLQTSLKLQQAPVFLMQLFILLLQLLHLGKQLLDFCL
jgi:hypothetical protein